MYENNYFTDRNFGNNNNIYMDDVNNNNLNQRNNTQH